MQEMSIAKALRYKKRVVSKINKLESNIIENNSVVAGAERDFDVKTALLQREEAVRHLIDVKMAISAASAPIQRKILECAEAKSRISFYNRVPTTHGKTPSQWEDNVTDYEAELRKQKRDEEILRLENLIDDHQSSIDGFNHANNVGWTEMREIQPNDQE